MYLPPGMTAYTHELSGPHNMSHHNLRKCFINTKYGLIDNTKAFIFERKRERERERDRERDREVVSEVWS